MILGENPTITSSSAHILKITSAAKNVGYNNTQIRERLAHPLILIPIIIGLYSIFTSFFQRLPVMALYGSPQIGQGAFWYFSLSILTILSSFVTTFSSK